MLQTNYFTRSGDPDLTHSLNNTISQYVKFNKCWYTLGKNEHIVVRLSTKTVIGPQTKFTYNIFVQPKPYYENAYFGSSRN